MNKLIKLVILTGLFFMCCSQLFCQTLELPPDSLIIKNKIKEIKAYHYIDSSVPEFTDIWKFDNEGKLLSHQLLDIEDPGLCIELYFYNGNLLKEKWHIATWQECDTVKTKYFYNQKGKLTKEIYSRSHYFSDDKKGTEFITYYKYINKRTLLKFSSKDTLDVNSSSFDSLVYNENNDLILLFNKKSNEKKSFEYNLQKQLVRKSIGSMSDTNYIYRDFNYSYESGNLTKESKGYYEPFRKEYEWFYQKYTYSYDENNLLIKIIDDNDNYTIYKYEFY